MSKRKTVAESRRPQSQDVRKAETLFYRYLRGHIHKRFIEDLDLPRVFDTAYSWAMQAMQTDIDRREFEDAMALRFAGLKWSDFEKSEIDFRALFRTYNNMTGWPKNGKGSELAGQLLYVIWKEMKISDEEADELVDPVGSPSDHLLDPRIITSMSRYIFEWLRRSIRTIAGDWIKYMSAKKRNQIPVQRMPQKFGDNGRTEAEFSEDIFGRTSPIPDEIAVHEASRAQKLEQDTCKKIMHFIETQTAPKDRAIFKEILRYRIMKIEGGKTYKAIGRNFNKSPNRVKEKEEQLIARVRAFLKVEKRGGGLPSPETVNSHKKAMKKKLLAQGYSLLKDETNREDFLDFFFDNKRTKRNSRTGHVIQLLAERRSIDEIVEAIEMKRNSISKFKSVDFVPMLIKWARALNDPTL